MSLWGNLDNLANAPKWITQPRTIDGTSNTVVDATNDTITIPSHGRITGDPVVYTSTDANSAIAGLTTGTTYYAIRVDSDTIALASNTSNATANTRVDITAVGTDTADEIIHAPANLYFVDNTEAQVASNRAKGLKTPGWWLYETYTDAEGDTRHRAELLVELSVDAATSGDAADDAVVADS